MKNILLPAICIFLFSCKPEKPTATATVSINEDGTPQYITDTTSKENYFIVPSGIQLPEADRFKREQFDTTDERFPDMAHRILQNEHYKISITYTRSGTNYSILVEDLPLNKIESWNFYMNGQLRMVGFSTRETPPELFIKRMATANGESLEIPPYEVWEGSYQNGELVGGTRFDYFDSQISTSKYYAPDGQLDSIVEYDKLYRVPYSKALEIAKANGFSMPGLGVSRQLVKGRIVWEIIKFDALKEEEFTESEMGAKILLIDAMSGKISKPDYFIRCSHISNVEKG